MSAQDIINTAQVIEFDRRRMVGQSISRSQRIKTAERFTAQPFQLTVSPQARFKFRENRDLIEGIMQYDRNEEQTITIGSNSKLTYITDYTGSLTTAQIAATTITNFTLTTITIGGLPSIGALDRNGAAITANTVVLKAGDWVQPVWSRYPYIVESDITRGSGTMTTGTVHRSVITSEATTTTGAYYVGTATSLKVIATKLPTYRLINRDWCEWTGDFEFVEKVI